MCWHRARNPIHRANAADHPGRKPPAQLGGGATTIPAQSRLCAPWAASCARSMAFPLTLDDPAATVTAGRGQRPGAPRRRVPGWRHCVCCLCWWSCWRSFSPRAAPTRAPWPALYLLRRARAPRVRRATGARPRPGPRARPNTAAPAAVRAVSAASAGSGPRPPRSGGLPFGRRWFPLRRGPGAVPGRAASFRSGRRFVPRRRGRPPVNEPDKQHKNRAPGRNLACRGAVLLCCFWGGGGAAYTSASSPRELAFRYA